MKTNGVFNLVVILSFLLPNINIIPISQVYKVSNTLASVEIKSSVTDNITHTKEKSDLSQPKIWIGDTSHKNNYHFSRYLSSTRKHPAPPGIRVYPYIDDSFDCANPNLPEIDLPFFDAGTDFNSHNINFNICSDGVLTHLTLFSQNLAWEAYEAIELFCYSSECSSFSPINLPQIRTWYSHYGLLNCMNIQSSYDENLYMPSGKYILKFWLLNLPGENCLRHHHWSQYMDFTSPRPSDNLTWAPENACLVGYHSPFTGHPINADSGNFTEQVVDMSIPSLGN